MFSLGRSSVLQSPGESELFTAAQKFWQQVLRTADPTRALKGDEKHADAGIVLKPVYADGFQNPTDLQHHIVESIRASLQDQYAQWQQQRSGIQFLKSIVSLRDKDARQQTLRARPRHTGRYHRQQYRHQQYIPSPDYPLASQAG